MTYQRLPTYVYVYKYFISLKPSNNITAKKETVNKLIDIWNRASLPMYSLAYIMVKLTSYIVTVKKLKRSINHPNFEN